MGLILNLRGPAGATGAQGAQGPAGANGTNGTNGATWLTGTGAPSDAIGNNNDLYLDEATGNVYKKVGGTWS